MKITLKQFQDDAVAALFKKTQTASRDADSGERWAIILASPTGSGKTVIVSALLERILVGDETHQGNPDATFLWLTDQPELNEQTRRKFLANSTVFPPSRLVTIDATFDKRRFEPGHVYFLNTQKIGREKQLVTLGDKREYTIWNTIENTVKEAPGSFWLCIDEAHRGMSEGRDRELATTIAQKFIKGSSGEIPPLSLIIGVSATPERFQGLLTGTARTQHTLSIPPDDVRESGLIKDYVTVYHPEGDKPSDWTLLRAAASKLTQYQASWGTYADQEGEPSIEPLLVVQVEDAPKSGGVSKTDIAQAIREIEAELGHLGPEAVAHCFQSGQPLDLGDRTVRYVAPVDVQDDESLRVVFFKTALNTGWDCPRAEVMMSFRRAVDFTSIAQLIGRMVRTPLARRVTTDEFLGTVSLYLPYYDKASLDRVVKYLENPDPTMGVPSKIRRGEDLVEVLRNPSLGAVFDFAATLPTYVVERAQKQSNAKRLVRLGRFLAQDKLDESAYAAHKAVVVSVLEEQRARLASSQSFKKAVKDLGGIDVNIVNVAIGDGTMSDGSSSRLAVVEQNATEIFDSCGRLLGEGLHLDYVKARVAASPGTPISRIKTELHALLHDKETLDRLEAACGKKFKEVHEQHRASIQTLADARRQTYRGLLRQAKNPEAEQLCLPSKLIASKSDTTRPKHLFADEKGMYPCRLNSWEVQVLDAALADSSVVGWLRNVPRQPWSFVVPYEDHGEWKPHYPDFLVFRVVGSGYVVDVLEPHALDFEDGWLKAIGMAKFAKQHGDVFGRIEMSAKIKGEMRALNVNDADVRSQVLGVKDGTQLRKLFEAL